MAHFTENLPECLGAVFNCTSLIANCHNSALFDFPTLWNITLSYAMQCPNGPWLFNPVNTLLSDPYSHIAITNEICEAIAGPSWKKYLSADIWSRLTAWKFPLWQLVANSPRPPLGFWVEAFSVTRLLGDPIGNISDLIRKMKGCQDRAKFWKRHLKGQLKNLNEGRSKPERQRLWKSLAIIVDSFDEWGLEIGDRARDYLLSELTRLCKPDVTGKNEELLQHYIRLVLQTGDALAADRSTKFVPVVIAQAFFIGSVVIAMIRTKSAAAGPHPSTYINIEMYSIAFTAQYFWIVFIVFWTSIIGVSQTSAAIPRILGRFRRELENELASYNMNVDLPTDELDEKSRIYSGGIYSWLPARPWKDSNQTTYFEPLATEKINNDSTSKPKKALNYIRSFLSHIQPPIHVTLAIFMVTAAAATGQLISALVPPQGWTCRSTAMLEMFLAWVVSYLLSLIPFRGRYNLQFWVTFVKDFIVVLYTSITVIVTQFGIYNRCSCYTRDGAVGLQLPFMPAVAAILESRLNGAYPAVVTVGLAIQLIIVPGYLMWKYHAAVQVFLQRDDGTSNLDWLNLSQRRKSTAGRYSAVDQKTGDNANSVKVLSLKGDEEMGVQHIEELEQVRVMIHQMHDFR